MQYALVLLLAVFPAVAAQSSDDASRASRPRTPAITVAPHLTRAEAIEIARGEARRLKIDLGHFDVSTATFEPDQKGGSWLVDFKGMSKNVDDCFGVRVNDATREAALFRCG